MQTTHVKNILYFEDDESWQSIISDIISRESGLALQCYPSSLDVKNIMSIIQQQDYALVIVDLILNSESMNRTHGLEIASIVRRFYKDTPIMILSSAVTVERIFKAADLNVIDIVVKSEASNRGSRWLLERIKRNISARVTI